MTHTDQRLLPLVVLETERLRLRAFLESDVDDVYKACSDPELQKWLPIPRPGVPYTREDAELWRVRHAPSMRTSGEAEQCAVTELDIGRVVGAGGCVRLGWPAVNSE